MKFRKDLLDHLVSSSLYNIIRQGMMALVGFVTSIILAKGLGVENRGVYALVVLFPATVLNFFSFGASVSITYFVARKDYNFSIVYIGNFLISLFLGLIGFGVAVVVVLAFKGFFFANVDSNLLFLSATLIPLMMFNANLLSVYIGVQNFKKYNAFASITNTTFLIILVFIIVFYQLDVMTAIFANLISYALPVGLILIDLKREFPVKKDQVSFGDLRNYIVDCLSYGLKAHFQEIISFLNLRSDRFLVDRFSGASSLGLYSIAVGFAEQLWFFSRSLSTALYPKIASLKDNTESAHLTSFVTAWTIWLSTLGSILAFLLIDWFVLLFFGNEYADVALGFKYLLPGIIAISGSRMLTQYIAAVGRPQINTVHSIIGLVINISINIFLIPKMGFVGASVASSISYSVATIIKAVTFCYMTRLSWFSLIVPQIRKRYEAE